MLFAVLFEDNPGAGADIRARHMPDHLAFLQRNNSEIRAAGPLTTGDGAGAGGMWLVEAADETAARKLVEEDPLWPTGLRKSVKILCWNQVFADGERLISPQ
ncbi:YciI family protein [Anderseniella sp. Alg231-50]|uniref:YciI family protein n=1 Tax=Anderseniella sp. Alg231-50 TaxID=1922226 RepID=UPI00307B74FB